MSEFMRIAYSTEITSTRTICYDTTDFDYSSIYECKDSFDEFRKEMAFDFDGYNY